SPHINTRHTAAMGSPASSELPRRRSTMVNAATACRTPYTPHTAAASRTGSGAFLVPLMVNSIARKQRNERRYVDGFAAGLASVCRGRLREPWLAFRDGRP